IGTLRPGEAAELCAAAHESQWLCLRADLLGCVDKQGLLEHLARDLGFPGWFGRNWDALSDCLRDLEWHPAAEGYLLVLEHADGLAASAPDVLEVALDILRDAAEDWASRGRPMLVYVDLAARGLSG
ncbi:MAG TPA: barstar family protein, partial [Steroidobacteraceae bacterium]|nr:barstar family protein [Steroidobacteraceae bacterium]